MRLAYGDFTYFIKKEDHPYRAFFRRYVARLLYLDTSWGGCSGFVDCILGHHHILIHLGPIAWTPVPSVYNDCVSAIGSHHSPQTIALRLGFFVEVDLYYSVYYPISFSFRLQ
jgi:hypothetical protein